MTELVFKIYMQIAPNHERQTQGHLYLYNVFGASSIVLKEGAITPRIGRSYLLGVIDSSGQVGGMDT